MPSIVHEFYKMKFLISMLVHKFPLWLKLISPILKIGVYDIAEVKKLIVT